MKTTSIVGAVLLFTLAAIQHVSATTNYVLSLSSSADYVRIPASASLDLTTNFTLEAWIKPSKIVNQDQAVIAQRRNTDGTGFALRVGGSGIGLALNNDAGDGKGINILGGGGNELAVDQWFHIAATYDGAVAKNYINGRLVESYLVSLRLLKTTLPITIGQENLPGDPRPFLGQIDEARIWNRALTQQEIQFNVSHKLTGQEPGLVGFWNFDDQTARDSSVYGNHGIVVGNAQIVEDPIVLLQIFQAVEILTGFGSSSATYQLQYRTNLQSAQWFSFSQLFTTGGQPVQFFDTTRDSVQKVYRVIRVR